MVIGQEIVPLLLEGWRITDKRPENAGEERHKGISAVDGRRPAQAVIYDAVQSQRTVVAGETKQGFRADRPGRGSNR